MEKTIFSDVEEKYVTALLLRITGGKFITGFHRDYISILTDCFTESQEFHFPKCTLKLNFWLKQCLKSPCSPAKSKVILTEFCMLVYLVSVHAFLPDVCSN